MRPRIVPLRLSLLGATFLGFCFTAAGAAAQAPADPRLRVFTAPPLVAQFFAPRRVAAAPPTSDLFAPFEASPLATTARAIRAEPDLAASADIALALLTEAQREMIVILDDYARRAPDFDTRQRRRAIAAAYAARGYAPFWRDGEGWSAAARAAAERLRAAPEDGLDLPAAPLPDLAKSPSAHDDLSLSDASVAYAVQAAGGRIDPARISHLIGVRPALPRPAAVLAAASAGDRAGDALAAYNPPHYGYQQLRAKLAELRTKRTENAASGGARFARASAATQNDESPAPARSAPRAGARLSAGRLEAEVLANMERWRWLPHDMGDDRIEVNIPEFELAVVRGGSVAHRARVIVGKETTPTPVFSNALKFIIVNPYWHVPQSIIKKEWGGDVSRAEAKGWKVSYRRGQVSVAQPPGESNALGRIKFMFPNDYSVYLHDTPSRNLFSAPRRAFSHGCMRVEDPFALAEAVLGPGSGWSQERVRRLIGASERYINLARPLPIHIEYFTAYVDEYGELRLRDDLYGYSARVRRALGLGG
jgi:L,D-transpeptidase YcbB